MLLWPKNENVLKFTDSQGIQDVNESLTTTFEGICINQIITQIFHYIL